MNTCYPSYGGHSIYDAAYPQAMETALAAADRVISERGELCYPHYLKGVTLMQQKKFGEAVAAYKKAIEYKSDDPMIWYALYLPTASSPMPRATATAICSMQLL